MTDLSASGLQVFIEEQVDVAVLEVGLGGRLDATNCIPSPPVCGVTPLGMDHVEILGDTIEVRAPDKFNMDPTWRADEFVLLHECLLAVQGLIPAEIPFSAHQSEFLYQSANLFDVLSYGKLPSLPEMYSSQMHAMCRGFSDGMWNVKLSGTPSDYPC